MKRWEHSIGGSVGRKCGVSLSFLVALLALAFVGCAHEPLHVPPVTPEPTGLHLTGKFVWFDLFTRDLPEARHFYEALLGWSFQQTPGAEERVMTIDYDGIPIGNAVAVARAKIKDKPSRWLSYMSVMDVDQAILRVEQHQGSVYMPARNLPDRGRVAVVLDPEGAPFALVASTTGDPPDNGFDRNDFFAAELWARDRDAAIAFYQAVAGYTLELADLGDGKTYYLLVENDTPRAGVVQIPWEDVKPNWVPYIAVADVDAVAEKVASLGGKLLIEPDPDIREGKVAIIADPSGAVFAVQQR
jgi:predicted enzyme related to lactoylglutathione lyase